MWGMIALSAIKMIGDTFAYENAQDDIEDIASDNIDAINLHFKNEKSTMALKYRSLTSSQIEAQAANGFDTTSQSFLHIQADTLGEYSRETAQMEQERLAKIKSIRDQEEEAEDQSSSSWLSNLL